jgi:hypothetical protein
MEEPLLPEPGLAALLTEYDPTSPSRDFDFLQRHCPSTFPSFSLLCKSLSSSLPALPLLLSLDFAQVLSDCTSSTTSLDELERWIGFVPEQQVLVSPIFSDLTGC